MLRLDHLAVSAASLREGVDAVEAALGVALAPGGQHAAMGTHNRLLGLGPGEYLEVIAIDPEAPAPGRPRWFGLDRFTGPPRLTNWVARAGDLAPALAAAPAGAGVPMALRRGDLAWQMAVPEDGVLPFGGAFPALIAWQGDLHPADMLPDSGCRLTRLELTHPEADALRAALTRLIDDPRLVIAEGPAPCLAAHLDTPLGERVLQ